MIGRNVCREEVADIISKYFLADSFSEQVALTDIIMDQITSIELRDLTVTKIRDVIEQEITVWMRNKEDLKWMTGN
jgi:hypothetical protein